MSAAALICAKGNSTRVQNKNTRLCGGKRLIEWALQIANNAACVDDVFVSTDSDEIRQIALDHGAVVLKRPVQLVHPLASGGAVQVQALKAIHDLGFEYDHMINIWCTSPLVQSWQIDEAYEQFVAAKWATQCAAVCRVKASAITHYYVLDPILKKMLSPFGVQGPTAAIYNLVEWVETTGAFGILNPNIINYDLLPEITEDMPREEVEGYYTAVATAWTSQTFPIMQESIYGYVIDRISAHDINTEDDLELADYYFKLRRDKKNGRI